MLVHIVVNILPRFRLLFFFFNDTATTEIYTLSLHDALPICAGEPGQAVADVSREDEAGGARSGRAAGGAGRRPGGRQDRKSTRLNSRHRHNPDAALCLKKKKKEPVARSTTLA